MLPPEEKLPSDKDLREASLEQLINLRDRMTLELQRRAEQAGMPMPPQRQPDVPVPPDPNAASEPRPGESTERPATD